MSTRVYCKIFGSYNGFRSLERFNEVVNNAWCEDPRFFVMYDPDTLEIFQCSFNKEESLIVAYAEVSVQEFRMRLSGAAESLIQKRTRQAILEASEEASRIYAEAEAFTLQHRTK